MTAARSMFDGRTTFGRNAARTPAMVRVIEDSATRPDAAFEPEQEIATPQGRLTIQRRWYGSVKDTNRKDWHYAFISQDAPKTLTNGMTLSGDVHQFVFTETVLLPLQLAAVPPITPTTTKLEDSPAGENHDAWAENLVAWVNERLNS